MDSATSLVGIGKGVASSGRAGCLSDSCSLQAFPAIGSHEHLGSGCLLPGAPCTQPCDVDGNELYPLMAVRVDTMV